MPWACKKLLCDQRPHIHDFFYKFGATVTWKMTKICSNYVRQHTTPLWDHYVARISFEVDRHLAVHDLGRTTWSHNLKCRTTHVAPTVHTTTATTRFMSHNLQHFEVTIPGNFQKWKFLFFSIFSKFFFWLMPGSSDRLTFAEISKKIYITFEKMLCTFWEFLR